MAATTPSTSLVPVQPVFTESERLALAGFLQEAASHADPRTTMRHQVARASLARHATDIVATYVAGAAR